MPAGAIRTVDRILQDEEEKRRKKAREEAEKWAAERPVPAPPRPVPTPAAPPQRPVGGIRPEEEVGRVALRRVEARKPARPFAELEPGEQASILAARETAERIAEFAPPPGVAPEFRGEIAVRKREVERVRLEAPITDFERYALTYKQILEQPGPEKPIIHEPTREEVISLRRMPTMKELEAFYDWYNGPGVGSQLASFLLPFAAIALLPVAWQFAPLLTVFVAEQLLEETGGIPGKPIGRLLNLPGKPLAASLQEIGLPEDVATILADIVVFAAIGKAKPGQKGLGELLGGLRKVSAESVAAGVRAIEATGPGAQWGLWRRGVRRIGGGALTPEEELAIQERLRKLGLVAKEAPVPGATLEGVIPRPGRPRRRTRG